MYVRKHGKIVDIPMRAGTIALTRDTRSGKVTDQKVLVVGLAPPDDFSRAYGRQAYICTIHRGRGHVTTCGAGDLYPVGRAKRVPRLCKIALHEFEENYPTLARRKRKR